MESLLGTLRQAPGGTQPQRERKPPTGLMVTPRTVEWHQVALSRGDCLHAYQLALLIV